MSNKLAVNPFRDIFEQYVDDASFFWVLRNVALSKPNYYRSDIHELDNRIDACLDGLKTSPEDIWDVCESALEFEAGGEVFTSAIVAFRSLEPKKIQQVVNVGLMNDDTFKGLVTAILWLPYNLVEGWLAKFLKSKDLGHKRIAIAVFGLLRKDIGEYLTALLQREDCVGDAKLYARCLRCIGELKRRDLLPALNQAMDAKDPSVVFWASWSRVILGDDLALENIKAHLAKPGNFLHRAIAMYFSAAPMDQAKLVISDLAKKPETMRTAILAAKTIGDPQVIPWLISLMENPQFARVAAEAFSHITGIDLESNKLELDLPELDIQPNEDDEDVELDEDEELPWPDVEKVKAVWQKYGRQYAVGVRHFAGKSISPEVLKYQLVHGNARSRAAAALNLTLMLPSEPFVNVKSRLIV